VVCYIKKYRNYGIQSSGRVESSHRAIKRHLRNRLASLDRLYEAIRATCAAQRTEYLAVSAQQRRQIAAKHQAVGAMFEDLLRKISAKAMDLIWLQYRLAWIDYRANHKTGNAYAGCKGVFNPNPPHRITLTLQWLTFVEKGIRSAVGPSLQALYSLAIARRRRSRFGGPQSAPAG
jgi:hypothetical protein